MAIGPFAGQNGAEDNPPLCGKSLLDYAQGTIDKTQIVLGDRYLERKTGMFLVAPSGIGKSTGVIQMGALWACGLPAFRIRPAQDLGIIIFQSEDSDNDLIEMCQVSAAAVNRFRQVILARKAAGQKVDLIIINPYTAYLLGDVQAPEPNNAFLRGSLEPLLSEFQLAVLVVHHTPKMNNQNTEHWEFWDWMYSGAGSAAITNWARAFIAIEPVRKSDLFRFIAAKRGDRIAEWEKHQLFCVHDSRPGVLLWNEVDEPAVQAARAKGRRSLCFDELLKLVPAVGAVPKHTLQEQVMNAGFNRASFRAVLDDALVNERLYPWNLPNPPARSITAIARYVQS